MSLSSLMGGADCGPDNPLQSFMKLDQDRGQYGQRDRFALVAGPSSQQHTGRLEQVQAAQEAEAFYQAAARSQRQHNAFDLKPLDRALGFRADTAAANPLGWVSDFMQQQGSGQQRQGPSASAAVTAPGQASSGHYSNVLRPLPQRSIPMSQHHRAMQGHHWQQDQGVSLDEHFDQAHVESKWEAEFQRNIDESLRSQRAASPPLAQESRSPETDAALARTASEVLHSIESDEGMNQKLAQSDFLKLMRQIRDHEMVVDGNQLVENPDAVSLDKGKRKAADQVAAEQQRSTGRSQEQVQPSQRQYANESEAIIEGYQDVQDIWEAEDRARMEEQEELLREGTTPLRRQFQGDGGMVTDDSDAEQQLDEGIDERFDAGNIVGGAHEAPGSHFRVHSRVNEGWSFLQDQWDAWEAHAAGVQPSVGHNDSRQTDAPLSAQEWMDLATLLQEQEQEPRAIEALRKALEVDNNFAAAWLSLAASLSNENQRTASLDAISSWIRAMPKYQGFVQQFEALQGAYHEQKTAPEKHAHLTSLLVFLAQVTSEESQLDADLQVALGVLFNSSDESNKAADCFMAALNVRPQDHQLYNRVGAALANSGRPAEALQAYEEALRLQPDYARARYNMAVSLVHLHRHEEAAAQLVQALEKQQTSQGAPNDADLGRFLDTSTESMSEVLWETLQTCSSLLDRTDLVMACKAKDLASVQRLGLAASPSRV